MKTLSVKIMQYSLLSGAFIAGKPDADAQVIYVDVEPDQVMDEPWEFFGIDLNDNDNYDFVFANVTFQDVFTFWNSNVFLYRAEAGAFDNDQNAIAASTVYWGYYGGYTWFYPLAFQEGDTINNNLQFEEANNQRMAEYRYFYTFLLNHTGRGNWFPELTNHFLGIRVVGTDDSLHYGWVRCSVLDSANTLIVHDYAFETQPNHPIIAGSTESYVQINNPNTIQAIIYSFNNTVYIKMEELQLLQISITDLLGKVCYESEAEINQLAIPLTLPTGLYVIQLQSEKGVYQKKIWLTGK
ncbi:MAG: T9SS type A sorting domain-containing protein [Chitinophagales bacterium]|nr:T9SS type A sorting domain-containing protein [Bacteroidota bacterium]MBK8488422.1 T9SS type A sorting domain-containing protein [Bacteroidota bacterium]MBP7400890.1 T9SS type A sorting domain-containing protein [Chitinophagales bacterium]